MSISFLGFSTTWESLNAVPVMEEITIDMFFAENNVYAVSRCY
jgi:hypothetical protein